MVTGNQEQCEFFWTVCGDSCFMVCEGNRYELQTGMPAEPYVEHRSYQRTSGAPV